MQCLLQAFCQGSCHGEQLASEIDSRPSLIKALREHAQLPVCRRQVSSASWAADQGQRCTHSFVRVRRPHQKAPPLAHTHLVIQVIKEGFIDDGRE